MEPDELRAWMKTHGRSADELAADLGVGRRTVFRYLSGTTPIPRTVELALEALAAKK